MTEGELMAIEQRLCIWRAGLNALGSSDRIPEDQQRATDHGKLLTEIRRLRQALDRDKTGLAAALVEIREEVKGRRWICEGRGDYAYDDDRYRQETGFAFDAIQKIAIVALATSGKVEHEALAEKRKCVCDRCKKEFNDNDSNWCLACRKESYERKSEGCEVPVYGGTQVCGLPLPCDIHERH